MADVVIRCGLTATILGERFKASCADLTTDEQKAWWQRTDYGWACSHDHCEDLAGVNYSSPTAARKGAEKHAAEHGGGTIEEALR